VIGDKRQRAKPHGEFAYHLGRAVEAATRDPPQYKGSGSRCLPGHVSATA
jgi:hypothetical protein